MRLLPLSIKATHYIGKKIPFQIISFSSSDSQIKSRGWILNLEANLQPPIQHIHYNVINADQISLYLNTLPKHTGILRRSSIHQTLPQNLPLLPTDAPWSQQSKGFNKLSASFSLQKGTHPSDFDLLPHCTPLNIFLNPQTHHALNPVTFL